MAPENSVLAAIHGILPVAVRRAEGLGPVVLASLRPQGVSAVQSLPQLP